MSAELTEQSTEMIDQLELTDESAQLVQDSNLTIEQVEESDLPEEMIVEPDILDLSTGNVTLSIHSFIIATFQQFLSIFR